MRLSLSAHFLYSWGRLFFFSWSMEEPSQKVIFHLTHPAACSLTDKPSGFAPRFVPADGTALLMGHSGTPEAARGRAEGRSRRVWVIVTLTRLWNAREKCGEWMSQYHGNKNKGRAAWLRLPRRLFMLFYWISLITSGKMFTRADSSLTPMGSSDFCTIFVHSPREQMRKTKQTNVFLTADNSHIRYNFYWKQN